MLKSGDVNEKALLAKGLETSRGQNGDLGPPVGLWNIIGATVAAACCVTDHTCRANSPLPSVATSITGEGSPRPISLNAVRKI